MNALIILFVLLAGVSGTDDLHQRAKLKTVNKTAIEQKGTIEKLQTAQGELKELHVKEIKAYDTQIDSTHKVMETILTFDIATGTSIKNKNWDDAMQFNGLSVKAFPFAPTPLITATANSLVTSKGVERDALVEQLQKDLAEQKQKTIEAVAVAKDTEVKYVAKTTEVAALTVTVAKQNETIVAVSTEKKGLLNTIAKLSAEVSKYAMWALIIAGVYLLLHYAMPSIDDELDSHYPDHATEPKWVSAYHKFYTAIKSLICGH